MGLKRFDTLRLSSDSGEQMVIGKVEVGTLYIYFMHRGGYVYRRLFRNQDGSCYFRYDHARWAVDMNKMHGA